jgi:hypothetical protein
MQRVAAPNVSVPGGAYRPWYLAVPLADAALDIRFCSGQTHPHSYPSPRPCEVGLDIDIAGRGVIWDSPFPHLRLVREGS